MKVELEKLMPNRTDRAVFVGMTGCGKTTLARLILDSLNDGRAVLVFDLKRNLRWQGYKRYKKLRDVIRAINAGEMRIIYAPDDKEFDDPDYHDGFFKAAFRRKNCVVYIDEVTLCTKGGHMPRYYKACIQQGRELGVSVYTATQRPKGIPVNLLTETENFYLFYLQGESDRDRVEEVTTIGDELQELPDHEFYFKKGRNLLGRFKVTL